ncbi:uncharacterized protein LOC114526244 [Dendronephthya gigantea]|uniref:uncharacterized protein LOC114526244 n=1 Tax=Dendronephthya gigantea TaxID=151771 RepID=UPI0010695250|nr:uncharacterized protein LOC114526244 [Dendronephthya gigantea]
MANRTEFPQKERGFQGHQVVQSPSNQCLADIAKDLKFDLNDDELKEYQEVIASYCETTFQRLYHLPEPKLPVKYPRMIGKQPSAEENPFNAWYWKCDISGAPEGKLLGKTIAMKDNIPVAGIPMMNGSQLLEGYIPDIDATVVTRVLDEGGRILGKAVCENMCHSGGSFTAANGLVRNPIDPSRMSGGSSSGCAVLVANKDVDMAIGGDQGGSIRMPAAACGIVGLKPTFGLVPYTGIIPTDPTIDHTGPMARTVSDTALLLEAIAGYDGGLDHRQPSDIKTPCYTKELTGDIKGMHVGLLKEGFDTTLEADVNSLVRTSALRLTERGAIIEEVSIPWHLNAKDLHFGICMPRAFMALLEGECSATQGYHNTHLQVAISRGRQCHANDFPPNSKRTLLFNRYLRDNNYDGYYYTKCQNLRRDLRQAYDDAFKKYDVLIMPTIPKTASEFPSKNPSLSEYLKKAYEMNVNTASFNLTGHPSLSINAGFAHGLPVGMMITGKMFDEKTVLNVAYAFEQLREGRRAESD